MVWYSSPFPVKSNAFECEVGFSRSGWLDYIINPKLPLGKILERVAKGNIARDDAGWDRFGSRNQAWRT